MAREERAQACHNGSVQAFVYETLDEHVQITRDGAMETGMKHEDIEQLYRLLRELHHDISRHLEDYA